MRRAAGALALFLCVIAGPGSAQDVTLTRPEVRVTAARAIDAGQPAVARDLAQILLAVDPQDRTALTILSGAELALGDFAASRSAARAALRLSETQAQRHQAQRFIALAAFREGRPTLAQYWLRRAAINAPDAATLAQTARDYAQVRATNPLSFNLSFALTPSSNVNGGAETDEFTVDGVPITGSLSGEAQALSGLTAEATVRLGYRLATSPTSRTDLTGTLFARAVALSDDARDTAPDAENSDFRSTVGEVSLSHARALGDGRIDASLTFGESHFGGARLYDYRRIGLGGGIPLADNVSLNGRITSEVRDYNVDRTDRITALRGGLRFTHEVGTLDASVRISDTESENSQDRSDSLSLDLRYGFAEAMGPALLSLSAGVTRTRYPDYSIAFIQVPGGREDTRLSLGAEAFLPDWDYAGFAPTITLRAARTDSNVSRFDRNEFAIGLGLRSTF